MSLRPPSLVQSYDDFFSGDPAIIPMPVEPEAKLERARKLAVARETGDWTAVLTPGAPPTKFVMRPLVGNVWREIVDALDGGKIRGGKMAQIAFRAAIVNVVDMQLTVRVETELTDRFGTIATVAIADYFDSIDKAIVSELGGEAMRRARDLSPK